MRKSHASQYANFGWLQLFFTHYSFHGLFIGKVTEEWMALQCVLYRMLTLILGRNNDIAITILQAVKFVFLIYY